MPPAPLLPDSASALSPPLPVYLLERQWSLPLVLGSYAISILGAYTTTQLMCQVPTTTNIWRKLGWIAVASVSFGGTGIWAMHFVSMLAVSIGIPVRYDTCMTLASAAIAIIATFITFAYEILVSELDWPRLLGALSTHLQLPHWPYTAPHARNSDDGLPLLSEDAQSGEEQERRAPIPPGGALRRRPSGYDPGSPLTSVADIYPESPQNAAATAPRAQLSFSHVVSGELSDISTPSASNSSASLHERSSSDGTLSANSDLAGRSAYLPELSAQQARREHIASLWGGQTALGRVVWGLWLSLTGTVVIKGCLMGLTVCAMHYSGMWSMRMDGWIEWDMRLVACSFLVAWAICIIAIVYMPMEPNFGEQTAFSILASAGVSAMHYVGMASGTFYTRLPPPHLANSVPPDLPLMILIVGTVTCLLSYAMLAHLVTQSRDRLADMIMTKRTLWKVIAEREAFERANRLKSEFISVASHEIRTPLHAISGYTDLLLHTSLTEEQTTYLEAIRMGCHSIQLITNNVLDFSKLEKGSKESNARPVEVNIRTLALRVVHSCAMPHRMSENELRKLAVQGEVKSEPGVPLAITLPGEKNVELLLLVDENVPAVCWVDEVYVTRVVMNLISNALKFTEEGYVLVHFRLEPPKTNDTIPTLAISVKDSGIGIAPELTQAIFEPFRQADTSLTRSHTGAGLGLAISKQLSERMGGSIDLITKQGPGSGSEFIVRLPGLTTKGEPITVPPPKSPPASTITLAVAVRSKKTFELIRGYFGVRGFVVRPIELQHPARGNQPALAKPDRLWIDIECLASAPWLYQHVISLQSKVTAVACFIVCDEVGTDLGLRTMSTLKDSGRIVLAQRPLLLHELEQKLKLGIPKSEEKMSPDAMENHNTPIEEKPTPSSASHELDTRLSPPLLHPEPFFASTHRAESPHRNSESRDQVLKALDPLQSVIREPSEARARKVRFQEAADASPTTSPTLPSPSKPRHVPKPGEAAAESGKAKPCILLVEDNLVNQKLGMRMLQKLNYRTELAANGRVALILSLPIGTSMPWC
ncbi:hypothetical protein CALVIDRAFT_133551 [Calocera viscosa TUFC12733]|uniref:histidine kinase n=1 Tax=Calocera viscosa (strain TUFC12733) TaxID=1330018 RepID=A0A167RX71_CALVF|nr:hypothetical protein CALVIDRAFT_133551 [Calocera viscosa TUFC12733]